MKCKYCDGKGRIVLAKTILNSKELSMDCSKCAGTGSTNTWYEVFVDKGTEGTESIYKTENKMDAIRFAAHYRSTERYIIHMDRWELDGDGTPQPVEKLF